MPTPSPSPSVPPNPGRRRFLRGLAGAGLGTLLLGGAGVAQGYGLGVTRHRHALSGLRAPLRVALLTDLHYGLYIAAGSVRAWVERCNAERPDLVLLGGDLFDRRVEAPPEPLLAELARLRAPLGVYAVWGNHDYGSFGAYGSPHYGAPTKDWQARRAELARALGESGVQVLRNEGRALPGHLWLAGTDDLWHGQIDLAAARRGAGDRATLLLTHNPDLLSALGPGEGFGLALCGHTHGGQLRLPLVGALAVPAERRYTMGWVTGPGGTPAYVSRGLGMSGVPLRMLCEPEIAVLDLTPA